MRLRELRGHAEDLGFTPQEPVRWLSPGQLAGTAVKVVLAGVFAGYADKREVQAALDSELLHAPLREPDAATELWIDFVADLGDGFDATATVAHAVAAEKITVTDGATEHQLNRGAVLVLGGDEVYPTASAENYEDRFKGPYRAALPSSGDDPLLVALPGNHDWYDGLTSFLRLFTDRQPIGGWQTRQARSYFAIKLPQHWWLVGLDSQLGNYIDEPQLEYFREHLSAHLKEGDGVIVCAAEPTWVKTVTKDENAFNVLHWFDRNIVRNRIIDRDTGEREETGASIRVWLTGDSHHYTRYLEQLPGEQADPDAPPPPDKRRRQMVTCGLGGAYLSATHRLPADLSLPPRTARMRDKDSPLTFTRGQTSYPDPSTSRNLAQQLAHPWSANWLGWRNPGFPQLAGVAHAAVFVMLSALFGLTQGTWQPINAVRFAGFGALGGFAALGLGGVAVALLLGRIPRGRRTAKRPARPSSSTAIVVTQLVVALAILAVTVAVPWPAGWPGWAVLAPCLLIAGALGAGLGTGAFALSVLAARSGEVEGWQMSGQAIEDYKGFLRLHIAPDGDLTIYPLAIDKVCREWELADAPGGGKRPVPASPLPPPRLIEHPVIVARKVTAS